MRAIWPHTFVEENNLRQQHLRAPENPWGGPSDQSYIQTGAAQGLPVCRECAAVRAEPCLNGRIPSKQLTSHPCQTLLIGSQDCIKSCQVPQYPQISDRVVGITVLV
jgi:hypothetical protein